MRARILFLSFALFACSSSAPQQTDTGNPPIDTPPADTPPPACDPGTYRNGDTGVCQPFAALTVTRSSQQIAPVRDHHSAEVITTSDGPYLYVLGGTDAWQSIYDDIQRAKIHDDGTLDPFQKIGSLPAPRAGQCMTRLDDAGTRWLVAGGLVQGTGGKITFSNTTLVVRFDAAGNVAGIDDGPALPLGVMHLTCDTSNGYVYAMGGRGSDSKSTTMSARAKIAADGSLGAFESQTKLSPDRSHHAAFIRKNRIYLVGGLTGDPVGNNAVSHADCVFAEIDDSGVVGAWKPAGKLPVTLDVSSAQLYEDAVYTLGGIADDSLAFTNTIRRATFNDDGTLSKFDTLPTTLPDDRGHVHDTPMWKSFMFSAAGQNDSGDSIGTVDVLHFGS
ncbi:MAG TPA: hypothetical protein VIF62_02765 [Labilithrix sp.]